MPQKCLCMRFRFPRNGPYQFFLFCSKKLILTPGLGLNIATHFIYENIRFHFRNKCVHLIQLNIIITSPKHFLKTSADRTPHGSGFIQFVSITSIRLNQLKVPDHNCEHVTQNGAGAFVSIGRFIKPSYFVQKFKYIL